MVGSEEVTRYSIGAQDRCRELHAAAAILSVRSAATRADCLCRSDPAHL